MIYFHFRTQIPRIDSKPSHATSARHLPLHPESFSHPQTLHLTTSPTPNKKSSDHSPGPREAFGGEVLLAWAQRAGPGIRRVSGSVSSGSLRRLESIILVDSSHHHDSHCFIILVAVQGMWRKGLGSRSQHREFGAG